ncbi:hypothetical protein [Actinocrispum wychmicini]|uniref:Uncharacterized protein n=1 Tax=Actinocrispum wychmicini TaxID=1213861 RepID=A0A4R2JFP5_9PSEU|nr:hypothetical protein [Actinocrispum wychmicini]TCO53075.1 hypothetical protein EV192_111272 [Actinocrispum wychmicini]
MLSISLLFDTQQMPRCRARTKTNTLCQNRVAKAGQRCQLHRGQPEAGPRHPKAQRQKRSTTTSTRAMGRQHSTAPTRPTSAHSTREAAQARRRQKRIDEATELCREILTDGWQETVASRATNYVTKETWRALFGSRRTKHCKVLADLANSILSGKQKLHNLLGSLVKWIMSRLGAGKVEQKLVQELAARLPLPWDAKLVAVARGVQVTGILLCLADGRDLSRCQCFIELALTETKTRVKKMLSAAIEDWANLAAFPSSTAASM